MGFDSLKVLGVIMSGPKALLTLIFSKVNKMSLSNMKEEEKNSSIAEVKINRKSVSEKKRYNS